MTDSSCGPDNTTHSPVQLIEIHRGIWNQVLSHLRDGLPNEGCGLLGGFSPRPGVLRVQLFYPGTNVLQSPTRFRMADDQVIRAMVHMRENGKSLVGIVHSHPNGNPTMSPTDVREAWYRDIALIIVGLMHELPDVRAWTVPPGEHVRPVAIDLALFNSH